MRRYAACIAAALLIASAGAALGEDTINIREVSGSEASLSKAQILKLKQVGEYLHGDLWIAPYDQGHRGTHTEKKDALEPTRLRDTDHYMGIVAAASTRPVDGAKRRIVVGDRSYDDGGGIRTYLIEPTDDGADMISGSARYLPIRFTDYVFKTVPTDICGGLFIDGESSESFVGGFMNDLKRKNTFSGGNNGGDNAKVGILIIDGRKLNNESLGANSTVNVLIDSLDSDSQFPVARVVAGDFDGDGIASEIAWVATPKKDPYVVSVYKVYRDSRGAIKTTKLHRGWYDSIDKGPWYLGAEHDSEPGCDIVAGDFDGDGRTEFAVVNIVVNVSVSGRLKLVPSARTFKHVDGEWRTRLQTLISGFPDFTDTYVPGVLAVAGDFDGDGHDEAAFAVARKSDVSDSDSDLHLGTIKFNAVKGNAPAPVLKGRQVVLSRRLPKWTPLASVISLAAGPTYAAAGDGGLCDELYMTLFKSDGKATLCHVTDPLGELKVKEINSDPGLKAAALLASDFTGESMAVDTPGHDDDEPAAGGSSSGCSTGAAGAFAIALLAAATRRTCLKRHI